MSGPREVEVPLARLQTGLEKRFPLEKRLFEVMRLRLSAPQLSTLPAQQRLHIALQLQLDSPLLAQPWQGQLNFSTALALEAAQDAILLSDTRVERFAGEGLTPAHERLLTQAARLAAESFLSGTRIYQFPAEQLSQLGSRYHPTRLLITEQGLQIRFEPEPPSLPASSAPATTSTTSP